MCLFCFKVSSRRSENEGARKVLKVPVQSAYTVLYLWAGNSYPAFIDYPAFRSTHSASNMSVNAVLSTMQCGYPRATHVNLTIGGASLNKICEKSYDGHRPPS